MSKRAPVRADLLDEVPGFNPTHNRWHTRREIPPQQLADILALVRTSPRVTLGLAGGDRYHLYLTAFTTGYRAGERASLKPGSFELDAPPVVVLHAKRSKNKKPSRQPLPSGVAVQMRAYLATLPADRAGWPSGKHGWHKNAAGMLRGDLEAAGVSYMVDGPRDPEYADFHALRHSFVSAVAASGAGITELQTLARHGDPRLTIGRYAHARPDDLARAVNRLALPDGGPSAEDPLAALPRDALEGLTAGLLVAFGVVFGRGVDTPRDTPSGASAGDARGPGGTIPGGG